MLEAVNERKLASVSLKQYAGILRGALPEEVDSLNDEYTTRYTTAHLRKEALKMKEKRGQEENGTRYFYSEREHPGGKLSHRYEKWSQTVLDDGTKVDSLTQSSHIGENMRTFSSWVEVKTISPTKEEGKASFAFDGDSCKPSPRFIKIGENEVKVTTKTNNEFYEKRKHVAVLEGYPKEKVGSQDYLAATIALKEAGYNEVEVSEKAA